MVLHISISKDWRRYLYICIDEYITWTSEEYSSSAWRSRTESYLKFGHQQCMVLLLQCVQSSWYTTKPIFRTLQHTKASILVLGPSPILNQLLILQQNFAHCTVLNLLKGNWMVLASNLLQEKSHLRILQRCLFYIPGVRIQYLWPMTNSLENVREMGIQSSLRRVLSLGGIKLCHREKDWVLEGILWFRQLNILWVWYENEMQYSDV